MKNWKTRTKKFLIMLLFAATVSTPLSKLTAKPLPLESEYSVCGEGEEDREQSSETILKP